MMSGQRRILLMQVLLISLAFLATAAAQEEAVASSFGRYHAVVIGNQSYQYLKKLNTPLNDARDIARILEQQYDFKVTLLLDKKRDEIMRSLSGLRRTMTKEDNLLIYYAGHGILDEATDVGYWQPIDADDSFVNWIPFTDLITLLKGLQANHILVIADSCFAGALQTTRNSGAALDYGSESWLRRMREKKSRTALTSGGIEKVLDGGGGNHSIFAKALIDTLRENNTILDGQSLFDQVKLLVVNNNAAQTPNYDPIRLTGHEFGDFIFVPKGVKTLPIVETTRNTGQEGIRSGATPRIDEDRHDWEMLSKLGEGGLQYYLYLHSNGKWADEARTRIDRLREKGEDGDTNRPLNMVELDSPDISFTFLSTGEEHRYSEMFPPPKTIDCSRLKLEPAAFKDAIEAGALIVRINGQPEAVQVKSIDNDGKETTKVVRIKRVYSGVLALCNVSDKATGPDSRSYRIRGLDESLAKGKDGLISVVGAMLPYDGQEYFLKELIESIEKEMGFTYQYASSSRFSWMLWLTDRPVTFTQYENNRKASNAHK